MTPSTPSWQRPGGADPDETELCVSIAAVEQVLLPPEQPLDDRRLEAELGDPTWVLVRTSTTYTSQPFAALTLLRDDGPSAELDAALSCASACFGMSSSRFESTLPPRARAGEERGADEALLRVAAAASVRLPPPSWDRVRAVVERARVRARGAALLLQGLRADRRYGTITSRDPRTGQGPMRVGIGSSPLAAFEGRSANVALDDAPDLSDAAKEALRALACDLELEIGRPVRITFELDGGDVRLVAVHPLRRFGLGAFALADDLAKRGVPHRSALHLIGPADVVAAVPLRIDFDPTATVIKGIAAGAGLAEGRVCVSPRDALALAQAGHPPILFVHDIEPDDIEALRASVAVVTVRGGLTGEAAVMARGLSKPCVASGAGMSLAGDHVRFGEGGVLRAGERVTIDGSSGLIVRGTHPRTVGELAPSVASILRALEAADACVIAAVDHPAHVSSAHRLKAKDIAVVRFEALFADAAVRGTPSDDTVAELLLAIFEAAKGVFSRVFVQLPTTTTVLGPPVGLELGSEDVRAYETAARRAGDRAGVEVVTDGQDAEAAFRAAQPPDSIVAARISSAR